MVETTLSKSEKGIPQEYSDDSRFIEATLRDSHMNLRGGQLDGLVPELTS